MTLEIAGSESINPLLVMMEDFFAMFKYPFDVKTRKQQIEKLLEQTEWGKLFVFSDQGLEAGYLMLAYGYSFEFGGRIGFIDELYIKPEFRGKGVGKVILKQLKEQMNDMGLASLRLEVEQYNRHAISLYESEGFEIHKTRNLMTYLGKF